MSVKKIVLTAVATLGIVLFLFPLVTGMLSNTNGVEKLTGSLRSSMTPSALAQTRADMNTVQAMSDQLQAQTLPALPGALGMSPDAFKGYMGKNFPDVDNGVSQLNTILPKFQGLVGGLEMQAPNFRKADEIPTNFLPSTTVPFLFLIPGAALFLLAGSALVLGREKLARATLVVSAVVGIVFIVAPLVLSVPSKAKAVDDLTTAFGPVFTDQGATAARADMDVIQNMSNQLQQQTLPALAGALDMNSTQFQGFMVQNYPDVATGVSQLNTILPRFQGLVSAIEENVGSFQKAASIPTAGTATTTLSWWFFAPGIILLAIGGIGIGIATPAVTRRRVTMQQDREKRQVLSTT